MEPNRRFYKNKKRRDKEYLNFKEKNQVVVCQFDDPENICTKSYGKETTVAVALVWLLSFIWAIYGLIFRSERLEVGAPEVESAMVFWFIGSIVSIVLYLALKTLVYVHSLIFLHNKKTVFLINLARIGIIPSDEELVNFINRNGEHLGYTFIFNHFFKNRVLNSDMLILALIVSILLSFLFIPVYALKEAYRKLMMRKTSLQIETHIEAMCKTSSMDKIELQSMLLFVLESV